MRKLRLPFKPLLYSVLFVPIILFTLLLCGRAAEPAPPATALTPAPTPCPTPTSAPTPTPVVLHSGVRPDGSFDEGTLFIGDSLTYGLIVSSLKEDDRIGDASYMAICGMAITDFFNEEKTLQNGWAGEFCCACSEKFNGLCYSDAVLAAGDSATAIYLMLGTNGSEASTAEVYKEVLNHILDACKEATVYIETIPYARWSSVRYESVNANIRKVVDEIRASGCERLFVLDTFEMFGTDTVIKDGIHIGSIGNERWYNYLIKTSGVSVEKAPAG